ncbi:MAG TPA: CHAT domain-containing tetratricopeptide repeat protein [Terracidiphilus sp.]|nr:CHAT domain-containing tetratricopeptide repeat protein [Terracidiphilus sp.]
MNSDSNPGPVSDNPQSHFEDGLAGAFEELIQGGSFRAGAPPSGPANGDTGELGATMPNAAAALCPEPAEWALLLGSDPGPAETTKVQALLAHAAVCGMCAQRLRAVSADVSPEESALLAGLVCASPQGQRALAAELARTPRQSARRQAARLYLWTGAGLAASLLIAIGLFSWWRLANNPERLLAEAYTQARIFDLRMPGAGFAEVKPEIHLRGGSTGRESARLLEARARIERQLENAPDDAHWLQLEARADILEEKFDPAIDILDRLVAAGPVTSSLLLDDASAYFQRGTATGSEDDRNTALESLRRADELAPGDPVVLFNEAVAMEDRGQVMNAVETWNRYLRFERDPRWLAEGRRRLEALEQKLNQLKSHQSRLEQHLATPQAMRTLARNSAALAAIDEELSTTLLPRLTDAAFPLTIDRSRGSPCPDECQAARTLLSALADSLELNHQDPWLTRFLPPSQILSDSSSDPQFSQAAHALAQATEAYAHGDYLASAENAQQAGKQFNALNNPAGEALAAVERADALQAAANYAGCYQAAHAELGRNPEFPWISAEDQAFDAYCDPAPGSDAEDNPGFVRAENLAHLSRYGLIELRVRNMRGGAAVDAGNVEAAWRDYLANLRRFYQGDYSALRLSGTLSGLEQVEQSTPRTRLALLLQREALGTLELTPNRQLIPTARLNLAAAAIRAGSIPEAEEAMRQAERELAANGGGRSVHSILAEVETAMANVYLDRGDLTKASEILDSAYSHMAGERTGIYLRNYAVARGQLALEQGHPEAAEPLLRDALLAQEQATGAGTAESIVQAQQNRGLYAILAAVWLAQGRSGEQILALWERYRLRILGIPVAACAGQALDCLEPQVAGALGRPGLEHFLGQVVLPDRLLLYQVTAQGVHWTRVPVHSEEVLAAAESLERAVDSPATPMIAVDRAARRVGQLLLDPLQPGWLPPSTAQPTRLTLEPDPLLGNLPWPSVATAAGNLGLATGLEESPSILLTPPSAPVRPSQGKSPGKALVVGASVASGESQILPEVLREARAVARFDSSSTLLVGEQATEARVAAQLATAAAIHFAGHAAKQDGTTRLLLAPARPASALAGSAPPAAPPAGGTAGKSPAGPLPDTPWLDSALLRRHPPRAARLAVFSACSSGKKEQGWNHGMDDIVATLASLGVPDVVATRWQIDSGAAVPMMDAFYAALARGLTVPQALTAARQQMVRDPRYRHPYYWAAWYASGAGQSDLSPIFHSGS